MLWPCDHCFLVLDDDAHFREHLGDYHRLVEPLDLFDFGTLFDEDAAANMDDLGDTFRTTPDNGEPAYAAPAIEGYNPLTEDFHRWRAARLARLQALDARLETLMDADAAETA